MSTIAPANPMATPSARSGVGRSVPAAAAIAKVMSGIVALSVAARLLVMCSWAHVMSVNGTTLLSTARMRSTPHAERGGNPDRKRKAPAVSSSEASRRRPATIVNGLTSSTTTSFMVNAEPQIRLNATSRAASAGFNASPGAIAGGDV